MKQATAKLRHIALSVPDPWKAAEFYEKAFGMTRVGHSDISLGLGVYLSDGTINLALIKYRNDEAAGERGADFVGLHHFGFWVDDAKQACAQAEAAGASWWMGEIPDKDKTVFYEVKYKDPNGVVFDITAHGWDGASKDFKQD